MRNTVVTAFVAAVFLLGAPVISQAEVKKLGFVDLSKVFDSYHKTKEYDKVLEAEQKAYETDRNKKIDAVREAQGKIGLLSDSKKTSAEQDIEKMKNELVEFDRQKREDLTKKRNEKIRDILLEIEGVVSKYAEKEGFDMIFNDRVLIYSAPSLDVTQVILDELNAK